MTSVWVLTFRAEDKPEVDRATGPLYGTAHGTWLPKDVRETVDGGKLTLATDSERLALKIYAVARTAGIEVLALSYSTVGE